MESISISSVLNVLGVAASVGVLGDDVADVRRDDVLLALEEGEVVVAVDTVVAIGYIINNSYFF